MHSRLRQVTEGSLSTTYEYDPKGNMRHARLPPNVHVELTYDALNRRTALIQHRAAGNLSWTYPVYDEEGNVLTSVDPNGQSTTTTYDELGRPDHVTFPAPAGRAPSRGYLAEVTYGYDANGNPETITQTRAGNTGGSATETITRVFDAFDCIDTETDQSSVAFQGAVARTQNRVDTAERLGLAVHGGATNYYDSHRAQGMSNAQVGVSLFVDVSEAGLAAGGSFVHNLATGRNETWGNVLAGVTSIATGVGYASVTRRVVAEAGEEILETGAGALVRHGDELLGVAATNVDEVAGTAFRHADEVADFGDGATNPLRSSSPSGELPATGVARFDRLANTTSQYGRWVENLRRRGFTVVERELDAGTAAEIVDDVVTVDPAQMRFIDMLHESRHIAQLQRLARRADATGDVVHDWLERGAYEYERRVGRRVGFSQEYNDFVESQIASYWSMHRGSSYMKSRSMRERLNGIWR